MILPSSYEMSLLLGLLALLCSALWITTYKLGGAWRFELYYFDFAFGTVVASLVAGFDGPESVDTADVMAGFATRSPGRPRPRTAMPAARR